MSDSERLDPRDDPGRIPIGYLAGQRISELSAAQLRKFVGWLGRRHMRPDIAQRITAELEHRAGAVSGIGQAVPEAAPPAGST